MLTRDHSWVNDVVDAGKMSMADALHAPQAHALTRSLGGPEVDWVPSLVTAELPPGRGCLLLCSDGLWNVAATAERLGELVRARPFGGDALAIARALVTFARDRSGHDNITAAVLTF